MITRIRTGVLCLHDHQLLSIELEDPATGERFWSLPGGEIEPGESAEDCAVRETLEETGYQVSLDRKLLENQYVFQWNGKDYLCTTHWFTAALLSDHSAPVDDADYLIRAAWLPWPDSIDLFNYHPSLTEAVNTLR